MREVNNKKEKPSELKRKVLKERFLALYEKGFREKYIYEVLGKEYFINPRGVQALVQPSKLKKELRSKNELINQSNV